MKLLTAIIRPERLSEVLVALEGEKLTRLTVSPVLGRGGEPGMTNHYRGTPATRELHRRSRIEVALADAQVERAVAAIRKAAVTGRVGDGKIWVQSLTTLVRICDGARDGDAIIPAALATGRSPQIPRSQ